jgi:hypothetical protein
MEDSEEQMKYIDYAGVLTERVYVLYVLLL